MKKLLSVTGSILIGYVILTSFIPVTAVNPPKADITETENTQEIFITEYEGRVAVYKYGELYMVTDTMVNTLPKADANKIKSGIGVTSLKELKSLLEDYCS